MNLRRKILGLLRQFFGGAEHLDGGDLFGNFRGGLGGLVWPASDFTSEATTANPRPASPARAASMVALSASRLVCEAIFWIRVARR